MSFASSTVRSPVRWHASFYYHLLLFCLIPQFANALLPSRYSSLPGATRLVGSHHILFLSSQNKTASSAESSCFPCAPRIHHAAIKTRNITLAMQFYSLLGFEVTTKFRAGPARAAWLESSSSKSIRLELIEVPSFMLQEPQGQRRRALDLMARQDLLGHNHFALDVTESTTEGGLQEWMETLNATSWNRFGKTLRVALPPQQQLIGTGVFELAFLYDADGALVELLNKQSELPGDMDSGWEPWDGQGFVGGGTSQ